MCSCSCRRLEARAQHVLPELDSPPLGGLKVRGGQRVERFLGGGHQPILVGCGVTARHVVVEVHWIQDLNGRCPARGQLRTWVEVRESDLLVEATVHDEREELLEGLPLTDY